MATSQNTEAKEGPNSEWYWEAGSFVGENWASELRVTTPHSEKLALS